LQKFSFPGFFVGIFLPLGHWSAIAYSPEGLFATTHYIWWVFPICHLGTHSQRLLHPLPRAARKRNTRFRNWN